MKKRILCILMLAALLLCGFGPYETGAKRVYDDADLLSEAEEGILQSELEALIETMSMDMIIVTTNDARGKRAVEYADDFYDENGFGYGDSYGPGILFLIDMDNREIYLSTAGEAMVQFTDQEIERMLDSIVYWMQEGRYYHACMEFTYQVKDYGDNADTVLNGYYDKDTDTFVEYTSEQAKEMRRQAAMAKIFSPMGIIKRLGIAILIGAVSVLIMCIRVNSHQTPGARVYLKAGSEKVRQRYDYKTNTTVATRKISRDNNGGGGSRSGSGSSHRSGGGRSHGGGGRGF